MTQDATMTTRDKIRGYILENYSALRSEGLGDDDSLLGVLDSLAVLGLIGFIEPEFSIELDPSDVTDDNFMTVSTIARLVESYRKLA